MHALRLAVLCLSFTFVGYGRRVHSLSSKLLAVNLHNRESVEIRTPLRASAVSAGLHPLTEVNQTNSDRHTNLEVTHDLLDSFGRVLDPNRPAVAFKHSGPGVHFALDNRKSRSPPLVLHMNRKTGRRVAKVSVRRNKNIISHAAAVAAADTARRQGKQVPQRKGRSLEEMGFLLSEEELAGAVYALKYAEKAADRASVAGAKKRAGNGRKRALLEALQARRRVLDLALAAEFREEMEESETRLTEWPLSRLVQEGYTCVGLKVSESKQRFMCTPLSCSTDVVLRFAPANRQALPFHKFSSGDIVKVTLDTGEESRAHTEGDQEFEGMIVQQSRFYFSVAVPEENSPSIKKYRNSTRWRLDMTVNTVAHERRSAAVAALATQGGFVSAGESTYEFSPLQRSLVGVTQGKLSPKELAEQKPIWTGAFRAQSAHKIERLNKSQRNAVRAALTNTLTLWQGPPGTGKTMTICALIEAVSKAAGASGVNGPKVLATSASNVAVDNILMGLLRLPERLRIVRVGSPARVTAELRNYTLEAAVAQHPIAQKAADWRRRAMQLDGAHAKRLFDRAREVEHKAATSILASADVVLATCVGSGQSILEQFKFPMAIVDEATQAIEPDVLCALRKAHAGVMVGDPAQLPPTVISQKAVDAGLRVPLFERLASAGVEPLLLNIQYRMHPSLAYFPSQIFYDGLLKSNPRPLDRGLPGTHIWPSNVPAAFIQSDTNEQRTSGKSPSYFNAGEASAVVDVVRKLLDSGSISSLDDVGIITPYSGQVRLLHERFSELGYRTSQETDGADARSHARQGGRESVSEASELQGTLEIRSVDGYQGREKEVMVLSTVRSNTAGVLGFVADPRRLNVAITRARRGLIVIGDAQTLNNDSVWQDWLHWLQKQGAFTTLSEFVAPPTVAQDDTPLGGLALAAAHR